MEDRLLELLRPQDRVLWYECSFVRHHITRRWEIAAVVGTVPVCVIGGYFHDVHLFCWAGLRDEEIIIRSEDRAWHAAVGSEQYPSDTWTLRRTVAQARAFVSDPLVQGRALWLSRLPPPEPQSVLRRVRVTVTGEPLTKAGLLALIRAPSQEPREPEPGVTTEPSSEPRG